MSADFDDPPTLASCTRHARREAADGARRAAPPRRARDAAATPRRGDAAARGRLARARRAERGGGLAARSRATRARWPTRSTTFEPVSRSAPGASGGSTTAIRSCCSRCGSRRASTAQAPASCGSASSRTTASIDTFEADARGHRGRERARATGGRSGARAASRRTSARRGAGSSPATAPAARAGSSDTYVPANPGDRPAEGCTTPTSILVDRGRGAAAGGPSRTRSSDFWRGASGAPDGDAAARGGRARGARGRRRAGARRGAGRATRGPFNLDDRPAPPLTPATAAGRGSVRRPRRR